MATRTLAYLASALGLSTDLEHAVAALAEALADLDRGARLVASRVDPRRGALTDCITADDGRPSSRPLNATLDHLPSRERIAVAAGARPVELGDRSDEFARMFGLAPISEGGWLTLRGFRFEGELALVVGVYEPKRFFGARTSERFAPSLAVFDLAVTRQLERVARLEAVSALEQLTQRLHAEFERRLRELQARLEKASSGNAQAQLAVDFERQLSGANEDLRRARRQIASLESQVGAAVGELEKAHIELHRRHESVRLKSRALYTIERLLTLAGDDGDPRHVADEIVRLAADDMQAGRCSLQLRAVEGDSLFLAASRGIPDAVAAGSRMKIGDGIAGRVAATREPLLARDFDEAKAHPLRQDDRFTTGSFISFPLTLGDGLVGVINFTNRTLAGSYVEDDVERVRLLALPIAVIAEHARLSARLSEAAVLA
jgi:hypothetical protein